jgi:rod shape-determining protein MreC
MEFLKRYKNSILLVVLLFGQLIGLATQVKRPDPSDSSAPHTRLLRLWIIEAIAPAERLFVKTGSAVRGSWRNYIAVGQVRRENTQLHDEVNRLRLEQAHLYLQAQRAQRLETLYGFKEQYVTKTLPAQVIGSSGTDSSHIIYIDKGENSGLKPELPVMTPDGVVGKIREVYRTTAQVLLLNDQQSGVGVILDKSRRQGIMKGSANGHLEIHYIMADEQIEPGEKVYTSGGDRIFPKGLEVGVVMGVAPDKDRDGFQIIRVKPNANLFKLEEVLVVTQVDEKSPAEEQRETPAEMLASRLPSIDLKAVEKQPATADGKPAPAPPPIKPVKALAPDRFSPPDDRSGLSTADASATPKPKLQRATQTTAQPVSATTAPKNEVKAAATQPKAAQSTSQTGTEPQQPQEH